MNDAQLLRYSRHIMLPQLDIDGQQSLLNASVLIIGMGGLGSAVALYLAAAGVGRLVLCDDDYVDLTNLQRQVIHTQERVDTLKVESAAIQLKQLNPDIQIDQIPQRLNQDELNAHALKVDILVDCTDNLATRFIINNASVMAGIPLVSAAAIRWEGQITVFDPRLEDSPCYQCFYGDISETEQTCSTNGVIGPLLGVMGSMQALEVMKLLSGAGTPLLSKVLIFDAQTSEWMSFKLKKKSDCTACNKT